jgi:alkaline phosphatase D
MSTRRQFLTASGTLAIGPLFTACGDGESTDTEGSERVFRHGVASGDPLTDAVVIWTRITAEDDAPVAVEWEMATDVALSDVVAAGQIEAEPARDFTVKVDVRDLEPGTTYYYRFRALGQSSPLGRTRTVSSSVERLRAAVVSCANYPFGFFNVYARIAARADLDLVIHLGDYLYEYAEGGYGPGAAIGRASVPSNETTTLEDYRARHAQYKGDPDLREVHRQHPFVSVWDDHEVANDAWKDGAQNHDSSEGDYLGRRRAAQQAYFEWMPIRELEGEGRVYRSFRFGDLADLVMLDTRHAGRTRQADDACDLPDLASAERNLLGSDQEGWFLDELSASQARGARWRLVGQQVMVAQLMNPASSDPCALNVDGWDGYAASRERFFDAIRENELDNVVVLTGDIHSSFACELARDPFDPEGYDGATGAGSLAVELVTPAVTSPSIEDLDTAKTLGEVISQASPHLKFVDLFHRGYLLIDVTPERLSAEWYHVDTIAEPSSEESLARAFEIRSGSATLVEVDGATDERADAPELAPAP